MDYTMAIALLSRDDFYNELIHNFPGELGEGVLWPISNLPELVEGEGRNEKMRNKRLQRFFSNEVNAYARTKRLCVQELYRTMGFEDIRKTIEDVLKEEHYIELFLLKGARKTRTLDDMMQHIIDNIIEAIAKDPDLRSYLENGLKRQGKLIFQGEGS